MAEVIAREKLTAYQRWELGAFDGAAPAPKAAAQPQGQGSAQPAVKLPTAEDIEAIHRDAHRQGYAAGYDEGTARARVEALRLHTLVENLDHALREFDQKVGEELVALAVEIARQVVRQSIAVNPAAILEVVREGLLQLPHQHAAIFLNPDDAALVRAHLGDQLSHLGHRVFEDMGLQRGGCRIEAAGSQVDATMETRWRRVVENLGVGAEWIVK
ncbi:MAG: flagellar assembly protein FliH [Pseudomonadota bacterium]|jgi:flagellar assembly protein FliH